MNRDDLLQLLTLEGLALLGRVHYDDKADVLKLVSTLRAEGHDPALVAAVLSQAKLRRRAASKFGEFAESMLFTEPGLEQATRLTVAAQHAERFRAAGIKQVADLGCGIGTESMALASLGLNVAAFEIDEVTAAVASYNLGGAPLGLERLGQQAFDHKQGRLGVAGVVEVAELACGAAGADGQQIATQQL